jgi:allantoinase
MTGERPLGWYCRYGPGVNTRRLVMEEGGFLYDSDYYGDELPFWVTVDGKAQLVVPYSVTNNDGQFGAAIGTSDQWFSFVRDAFDMLYREGATAPKMMSVGLHMRLIGHPARAVGLARLLDHIQKHSGVWVTRRLDIARHWIKTHPYPGKGLNE